MLFKNRNTASNIKTAVKNHTIDTDVVTKPLVIVIDEGLN